MANVDTEQAITTNIESILTTLGWQLEDLTTDPDIDITTPSIQVLYLGTDFESESGQVKEYNEIRFNLKIQFSDKAPATSKRGQSAKIKSLRTGITIDTLNVGDLETPSNYVSKTIHPSSKDDVDYEPPVSKIDYLLNVRYKEI